MHNLDVTINVRYWPLPEFTTLDRTVQRIRWQVHINDQPYGDELVDYSVACAVVTEIRDWTAEQVAAWCFAHPRFGNEPLLNDYAEDFASVFHRDDARLRMRY